jgi:hypothetical protein
MADKSEPPTITINLAVEPAKFHLEDQKPTLTFTAASNAAQPITIFTWPTIFNLSLAQRRRNFTCVDLTADKSLTVEKTKGPRRLSYDRTCGGGDDNFFCTLDPGKPVESFIVARGELVKGHRYRVGVSDGQAVHDWWYGTRKDVMAGSILERLFKFARRGRPLLKPSGEPIHVVLEAPIEFEVLDAASGCIH